MKIATIIGARPQFIKAAPVSRHLKRIKEINEIIIHTGQHYEKNMSDIFFKQLDIKKPNYNLDINQADYSIMIEKMVASLVQILIPQKIDGVLVYGWDSYTPPVPIALISSSYAYSALAFDNNTIIVATKNGVEIYEI